MLPSKAQHLEQTGRAHAAADAHGDDDMLHAKPLAGEQRVADEASGPVKLMIVEDGNHIANNRPYRYRLRSADWMAEQLGLPRL